MVSLFTLMLKMVLIAYISTPQRLRVEPTINLPVTKPFIIILISVWSMHHGLMAETSL